MKKTRILVVDDESGWIEVCRDSLRGNGIEVTGAGEVETGIRALKKTPFELLIADLKLPDGSGLDLVRAAEEVDPDLPTIIMTAYPTIETAIEAVRHGAYDYLVKPFKPDQVRVIVRRALERRRLSAENRLLAKHVQGRVQQEIIGESRGIKRVFAEISQVAPTESEVLITGESGTGKELVARAIHRHSRRSKRPFVPIDCSTLPEALVEGELFGHEKGAYTGAGQKQIGLLDYAEGGTIFFDEIGELIPKSQAKLLRVLQERQFRRVGGREVLNMDVRVIAATNRRLEEEVRSGRFRQDLYYRLNVFEIAIPPLRERAGDVPLLVDRVIHELSREFGVAPQEADPAMMEILSSYAWPGNVRELRNAVKRALILAGDGPIQPEHLPPAIPEAVARVSASEAPRGDGAFQTGRCRAIEHFEREYLNDLLQRHSGRVTDACTEAGLSRSTLYFLAQRHGIEPAAFRGGGPASGS